MQASFEQKSQQPSSKSKNQKTTIGLGDKGGTSLSKVPAVIGLSPTKQNRIDLTSDDGLEMCCHRKKRKFSCNKGEILSQLDVIPPTRVPTHASQNNCLEGDTDSKQSHHSKPSIPIATNNHPNDDNLTEKVRQAIKEHFPLLHASTLEPYGHFSTLVTFVRKFIERRHRRNNIKSSTIGIKLQDIKDAIDEHLPNRAFFILMHSWSRRPKRHFPSDAINTLAVVQSNLKAVVNHASVNKTTKAVVDHSSRTKTMCDMSRFLLTCRQWKVLPADCQQEKAKARFEGQDGDACDQIVSRIDFTVQLLHLSLFETQTLSMTRVRMNSVAKKQRFELHPTGLHLHAKKKEFFNVKKTTSNIAAPESTNVVTSKSTINVVTPQRNDSAKKPSFRRNIHTIRKYRCQTSTHSEAESSGGTTETETTHVGGPSKADGNLTQSPQITFPARPRQACHMPQSFRQRLWKNTKIIRLGCDLFLTLFEVDFVTSGLHAASGLEVKDRVLQFLF